jgi:hypothetical protein
MQLPRGRPLHSSCQHEALACRRSVAWVQHMWCWKSALGPRPPAAGMSTTKPPQKVLAVTAASEVANPLLELSARSLDFTYIHTMVPPAGPLQQALAIKWVLELHGQCGLCPGRHTTRKHGPGTACWRKLMVLPWNAAFTHHAPCATQEREQAAACLLAQDCSAFRPGYQPAGAAAWRDSASQCRL